MISKETIKEVIKSNEEFINNQIGRILPRQIMQSAERLRKVNVIYGVRRCGKTFVLYDIFKKNKGNTLYIDFEDERLGNISAGELDKIRESFFELYPELLSKKNVVFLFDEIQKVEGWERYARRLVEKEGITLYIAGSSSRITPQEISSTLRGREWSIPLFPFSFREFLMARGITLNKEVLYGKEKIIINRYLLEYLKYGGFPEVVYAQSEFEKQKILNQYLNAMFFKDLIEQFNITNFNLLETLKENLFSNFGSKFSGVAFYKQFKDKFPLSKSSIFNYYHAFMRSMLIFETKIFSSSVYRRLRNPAKIYLVDIGLATRTKSFDWGHSIENVVYLELKRAGYEVYYHSGKYECDFIIRKSNRNFEPLQVTWEINDKNKEREYSGLIEACRVLKKKKGYIITKDQESEEVVNGIKIKTLPFIKWLCAL